MRTRILPPEEWARVPSDPSGLIPYCAPKDIALVAVESDDGEILAHVTVMQVTHFEGLWIKPEERGNAGVFRSLIRQAYALPQARGQSCAIGGAAEGDSRMDTLCHRLGGNEMPLKFYAIPVGGNDAV